MMKTIKKTLAIVNMLGRCTVGNGEIVGVLVATGVAVTAGYTAVNSLGSAAQQTGSGQGGNIGKLPGAK